MKDGFQICKIACSQSTVPVWIVLHAILLGDPDPFKAAFA